MNKVLLLLLPLFLLTAGCEAPSAERAPALSSSSKQVSSGSKASPLPTPSKEPKSTQVSPLPQVSPSSSPSPSPSPSLGLNPIPLPVAGPADWDDSLNGPGVSIHNLTNDLSQFQTIANIGFKWVRTDVGWSWTETQVGVYDFSGYDSMISLLNQVGLRPYFTLDYSNPLYGNKSPTSDPATRTAFAKWAAAAIEHFNGKGVIWEVLNEPDVSIYWPFGNTSDGYVALIQEIYANLPNGTQVLMVGPASSEFGLFFTQEAIPSGLLNYVSAISIHPYRIPTLQTPESTSDFGTVRDLIQQYGPPGRKIPVISGEVGYSSFFAWMDETWQAQMLAREFLYNNSNNIPITIWYDWMDDSTVTGSFLNIEQHFGLVTSSLQPKPAYSAANQVNHFLAGATYLGKASLSAGYYCYEYQNGSNQQFAAFTSNALDSLFDWLLPKTGLPVPAGTWLIYDDQGNHTSSQYLQWPGMKLELSNSVQYIVPFTVPSP